MNKDILFYALMGVLFGATRAVARDFSVYNPSHIAERARLGQSQPALSAHEYNENACRVLTVVVDASFSTSTEDWTQRTDSIGDIVLEIAPEWINVMSYSNYAHGIVGPEEFRRAVIDDIRRMERMGGGSELSTAFAKVYADLPAMLRDKDLQNTLLIFSDFRINTADRAKALAKLQEIITKYPGVHAWCVAIAADREFAKAICGDRVIFFDSVVDFSKHRNEVPNEICIDESTGAPTTNPTQGTLVPTTQKPTGMPTTKPTHQPTTRKPTRQPTTQRPTQQPTARPTQEPTRRPTTQPSQAPSQSPTEQAEDDAWNYAWLLLLTPFLPGARRKMPPPSQETRRPLLSGMDRASRETQPNRIRVAGEESEVQSNRDIHGLPLATGGGVLRYSQTDSRFEDVEGEQGERSSLFSSQQEEIEQIRRVYASFALISICAALKNTEKLFVEMDITDTSIAPLIDKTFDALRNLVGLEPLGLKLKIVNVNEEEESPILRREPVPLPGMVSASAGGEEEKQHHSDDESFGSLLRTPILDEPFRFDDQEDYDLFFGDLESRKRSVPNLLLSSALKRAPTPGANRKSSHSFEEEEGRSPTPPPRPPEMRGRPLKRRGDSDSDSGPSSSSGSFPGV